jgi:Fe-S-cluster containining protein
VTAAPRVRALAIHADYRCRSTGACCSSGWEIPIEPEPEERIGAGLASGRLRVLRRAGSGTVSGWRRPRAGLPHGARVALLQDPDGTCVFLDPESRLCGVHRDAGADALPSACRHFPRAATLTPLGVSVTLSHYCPTAAALLFRAERDLEILEHPPAFPPSWPWEGLDARQALPPLLRPGVLMDWSSLERWERFCVSVLAEEGRGPEGALDVLSGAAEEARRWTPKRGAFGECFEGVLEGAVGHGNAPQGPAFPGAMRKGFKSARNPANRGSRAWRLVADTVSHRELLPPAPEGLDEADHQWVAPQWPTLATPVRRWLAAKAFASWVALQGEGLRTTAASLRVALAVLRAEAGRGCAGAVRPLDAELLTGAFRRADLLLVHLACPEALARRLSRGESAGGPLPAW